MDIMEIKHSVYGECLQLIQDELKIVVTLDFGPRIIYYGYDFNLLYEDLDNYINKKVGKFHPSFDKDAEWHIYGGHRIWKAPEDNLTYYPDNNKVGYVVEENKVIFKPPVETSTNLQKEMIIEFVGGEFKITNKIINMGAYEIKISAWGLTVFRPSGTIILPYNNGSSGYLPNRSISLWDYTSLKDQRLLITDEDIRITIDPEHKAKKEPLKIGVYLEKPSIIYLTDSGYKFIKRVENYKEGFCLDYSSNVEIYTINKMVELETLSPLVKLQHGEEVNLIEYWNLTKE